MQRDPETGGKGIVVGVPLAALRVYKRKDSFTYSAFQLKRNRVINHEASKFDNSIILKCASVTSGAKKPEAQQIG
jgi:hypothetical protein